MNDRQFDDEYRLRRHRQFVLELEREIGPINRQLVHEDMPRLTRAHCLELATVVARSRATYLNLALKLGQSSADRLPDDDRILELREARRRFEELRDAFTALERAIECGYVDIELDD
ncbi:hypothetical protein [Wenzhouxiangella limi]|uniref:Uncharacterized protein n=1 Tax=Wenzhouxiangella limi TaxID=2707351 RepID=A0A845UT82_9GAMM|nr:hypothetical protein [Wenzhouxiangella limi]NDY94747.1 hypothetical protein [Wenzhouxiangella limi]